MLIVDRDGAIVHATMPTDEAVGLAGPTLQLLQRARSISAVRADDELRLLCVRTRKHEMLMSCEADGAYAICVLQDAAAARDAPSLAVANAARTMQRAGVGEAF